jgi:hypothetical protein
MPLGDEFALGLSALCFFLGTKMVAVSNGFVA